MKSKITEHFSTGLLLPIDITDISFGKFFFKTLQDVFPEMMPRKYGNTEPLKNIFDGDLEKMLLNCWKDMFIWKSKVKSTEAIWNIDVLFGQERTHSSILIYGDPNKFRVVDIKKLYRELIKHKLSDIGHIHILAEPELIHYKQYYNEVVSALDVGFNTVPLMRYIGNLAWGMFFGKPYIEMMGLEKLLKAPAFLVEQWNNVVYMQVTENIEDTFKKYEEFDRIRTEIKEYLGRQYFFHPDLARSEYRVPRFDFLT